MNKQLSIFDPPPKPKIKLEELPRIELVEIFETY